MTDEELNAGFGLLVDAQVRFQSQLGDLARIFRERAQQQDLLIEKHEQEIQPLQQRQAESDERFNMLLEEIRFLIRQQQPPPASDHPQS